MNVLLVLIILVLLEATLSDRQSEEEELKRIRRQDEELANCDKCGQSFEQSQRVPVIINGTNVASSQKYPWMVALIQTGTDHIFCGGAIISQYYILTAAHCMVEQSMQMKMDNNKKSGNGTKKGGTKRSRKGLFMSSKQVTIGFLTPGWYTGVKPATGAANIMVHPEYYYDTGKVHDIALIKLSRPINCNTHANPICLPPPNILLPSQSLVRISGYGQQDPANPVPAQELSEAVIEVIDKSECLYTGLQKEDLDKMYCLRGYKGETPCFGDSGGSMFSKLYGNKYVTIGVASLQSSNTCRPEAVVTYTSVPNHLPWIHEMMRGGSEIKEYESGGGENGGYDGGYYESGDYGSYDYGSMKGKKKGTKGKSTAESSSTQKGKKGKQNSINKKGESSTEMSIYKKLGLKPKHKAV